MSDALVRHEAERAASSDRRCPRPWFRLEAAQVDIVDVGYSVVVLVVFGLADRCPLFGLCLAIDDELGESV